MEKLTARQIQIRERATTVEKLRTALQSAFGNENVYQVGDSEFSIFVGNAPTGERMYHNIGITVKEYEGRKTTKRIYKPYDGIAEAEAYQSSLKEKAEKNAEKDKLKAEKMERDKKAREKQKEAREKIRQEKMQKQKAEG